MRWQFVNRRFPATSKNNMRWQFVNFRFPACGGMRWRFVNFGFPATSKITCGGSLLTFTFRQHLKTTCGGSLLTFAFRQHLKTTCGGSLLTLVVQQNARTVSGGSLLTLACVELTCLFAGIIHWVVSQCHCVQDDTHTTVTEGMRGPCAVVCSVGYFEQLKNQASED